MSKVQLSKKSAVPKSSAFQSSFVISICLYFSVCQLLRVFLAGLAVYFVHDTLWCIRHEGGFAPPLWTMCAESISSLLIMINFSGIESRYDDEKNQLLNDACFLIVAQCIKLILKVSFHLHLTHPTSTFQSSPN